MTDAATQPPQLENLLLSRLAPNDRGRLEKHLETIVLDVRTVLCRPGEPMEYAYFPTSSMLSSIVVLENGVGVEAATAGNEGMAGVGLLVDERASPYRVVQQVKGESLRIRAGRFVDALAASQALRDTVQRYTFTMLQQCGQNAACNLHHRLENRMSRWLLQTSDRAGRNDFEITQEFLSEMLGVSRQTVNVAARLLQAAGLIEYRRGYVRLQDRPGLEESACECYRSFNESYARYMKHRIEKPS